MPVTEIGDPRLQALFGVGDPEGVRPAVRLPQKGISTVAVVIGAVLFGLVLFMILNGRRMNQTESLQNGPRAGAAPIQFEAPPLLYIPPAPVPEVALAPASPPKPALVPVAPSPMTQRVIQPQTVYLPPPVPVPQIAPLQSPPPPARTSAGAALVIDSSSASVAAGTPATAASSLGPSGQTIARMRASAFANRSTTIPQGFLIPAVLETGFDSTSPGFARAVVSHDVRGFDGKNVLIPRGSRLIGEYSSEVAQTQRRVAIIWTRLMRPDGMTIAMNSPAVDTVGRGGVAASVNTHFFQRLGDALLQSSFEVGRALAGRAIDGPIVVVSANETTAATQVTTVTNYVPTLTIPAGKSISVFVAHDLDFSAAGTGR